MLSLAALLCAAAMVWAQYQVNPQVNRQVNTALYATGSKSSIRYASQLNTSVAMRSEVRYAYWKSGALPSDIRMGYAAIGPLAPGGPLSYIPQPGPSYMPQRKPEAPPAPMGAAAYTNIGTIRYATPTSSNIRIGGTYSGSISPPIVKPTKVSSSLVTAPKVASPSMSNSIRYNP